jgi:hypothetical protein
MNCWKCGREIDTRERVGFRDYCPGCDRALHVCLNCEFYEPTYNNQCRETQAARVVDKDRANFCDYFAPLKGRRVTKAAPDAGGRAKLDALFKKKG